MPKTILVAEDGRATREMIALLLSNHGYTVVEAADGAIALAQIKSLRPDLVILDSEMPTISGYDVFRQVKHDPDLKNIPILFLVADTKAFDIPSTRIIPPAPYLISKPFKAHDLLERVAKFLA
jgi:CheY-like chemotaxis protein